MGFIALLVGVDSHPARKSACYRGVMKHPSFDADAALDTPEPSGESEPWRADPVSLCAVAEVDRTLIAWALGLSPRERLRAAVRAGRALGRFHRVAS